MAHLFQPSLIPAFDSNGRVVSGALLHFYKSGTLVPVTVYANTMETAALPNPVPALSNGRFPPVYLNERIVHRMRLTTPGGSLIVEADPVNVYDPLGAPVRYYRFGGFAIEPPIANEVLVEHIVTDDFTLPADMLGAFVKVGVNPAAPWVLDVRLNGESVGTITLSTSGTAAFETVERSPVAVEAGGVFSFVAPAVADLDIERLRFTLKGTL